MTRKNRCMRFSCRHPQVLHVICFPEAFHDLKHTRDRLCQTVLQHDDCCLDLGTNVSQHGQPKDTKVTWDWPPLQQATHKGVSIEEALNHPSVRKVVVDCTKLLLHFLSAMRGLDSQVPGIYVPAGGNEGRLPGSEDQLPAECHPRCERPRRLWPRAPRRGVKEGGVEMPPISTDKQFSNLIGCNRNGGK